MAKRINNGEGERPSEPGNVWWEGERPREPHPQRRKPASGVFVSPIHTTIVFLTVCTDRRLGWLAQPVVHETLRQVWGESEAWLVGRYVLMPDHLHMFCAPGMQSVPLDGWVRYWKRLFTLRTSISSWRWQSHHWDTRLRRGESYAAKWQYVMLNPVRKGLVEKVEDWPYQGELNQLPWY